MIAQLKKYGLNLLVLAVCAAFALPTHASDADGERGISIFDKNPECMDRELTPADNKKCPVSGSDAGVRVAPASQGRVAIPATSTNVDGARNGDTSSSGANGGSGAAQGGASVNGSTTSNMPAAATPGNAVAAPGAGATAQGGAGGGASISPAGSATGGGGASAGRR